MGRAMMENQESLNNSEAEVSNNTGSQKKIETTYFSYSGDGAKLLGLYFKNIFLSILTFGFYRFWGKVEIKKYISVNTEVFGRSFGYHATGKELCKAFLIALGMLAVIGAVFAGLFAVSDTLGQVVYFITILGFILVGQPWLMVAKFRFLLSRTSWSNVRFNFKGDWKDMVKIAFSGIILIIITLGIYAPWYINDVQKFIIQNSSIGRKKFNYSGHGKELFFLYFKGILLTIITVGFYGPWFLAAIYRYFISNTDLDGHKFNSEIKGWDFFLIQLAIYISFGIFIPVALNYAFSVFFSKLSIEATEDDFKNLESEFDQDSSALADGVSAAGEVADALAGAF
jgi:uncharacterized membrane protein YjgN (DUF898 family)